MDDSLYLIRSPRYLNDLTFSTDLSLNEAKDSGYEICTLSLQPKLNIIVFVFETLMLRLNLLKILSRRLNAFWRSTAVSKNIFTSSAYPTQSTLCFP